MNRAAAASLVAPASIVILVFFLVPLAILIGYSLLGYSDGQITANATAVQYLTLLTDPFYLGIIGRTVLIAGVTTLLCALLGYPIALAVSRAAAGWRPVLVTLVLTPLLIGGVVRSYGWLLILDKEGLVNSALRSAGLIKQPLPLMFNFFGIIATMVEVLIPFFILPLLGALSAIDPDLSRAARSMGATRLQAFLRVSLPLSMAGVVAGATIVFSLALNLFEVPRIIGGPSYLVMATLAYQQVSDVGNLPFGSAIATLMLALTIAVVATVNRFMTGARTGG